MATRVEALEGIESRASAMLDKLWELQTSQRVSSDAVISQPFMRDHTEFDSFVDFVDRCPWSITNPSSIREVPRDELDDYVATTTDFETWEEMETQAAEEALVEQHLF